MFAITRLLPIVHVGAFVAAAVTVLNVAFFAVNVLRPGSEGVQPQVDYRARQAHELVDAGVAQYRAGKVDPDRNLCVLLGTSAAQFGLSVQTLTDSDRGDCLYLGLCFAGNDIADIAEISQILLESELRPRYAVLAINPYQTVDADEPTDPPVETEPRRLWLSQRRGELRQSVDGALLAVREPSALGAKISQFFEPTPFPEAPAPIDPWLRDMTAIPGMTGGEVRVVPDRGFGMAMNHYEIAGCFEATNYHHQAAGLQSLIRLVGQLQDAGMQVIIAWNPEHSALRARIPPGVVTMIREALDQEFGVNVVPDLDFRGALDDAQFTDVIHPNAQGRDRFSRVFAERISDLLYATPQTDDEADADDE